MSKRGSTILVLLAALLVLAIGYFVWHGSSRLSEVADVVPAAVNSEQPQAADTVPGDVLDMPQTAYAGGAQSPAAAEEAKRVAVEKSAKTKDADALWISGRLVYPAGTPLGETVDVVAKSKGFTIPRARVEASGEFRIALAPKSRSAIFDIEARHLFLRKPLTIKIKDGKPTAEVVLEPELGGCFEVQLHVPPQSSSLAPKLVGNAVASFGMSSTTAYPSNRMAVFGKDLRAQLRGLDAKLVYSVSFDSTFFAKATLDGLYVEPGETRQLDLDLSLGVELRGRLTIPGEGLPPDLLLRIESTFKKATSSGAEETSYEYAQVDNDGGFEARGVTPGKIKLRATANQLAPAELDLGSLADGDVREAIELTMGLGGQIGGHVNWQDGTPAVGAVVQLLPEGKEANRRNPFLDGSAKVFHEAIVDAEGAFLISGLTKGPLTLIAHFTDHGSGAKAAEAKPKGMARIESVAIGTLDLKVVLQGGYSITGSVVDDAGAPIQKFRVSATPQTADVASAESKPTIVPVSNKQGRFELTGLLDGNYAVEVSASRHEESHSVLVRVPVDTAPLTFVLARRASISGVVVRPDGTPAAQARLHIQPQDRHQWMTPNEVNGLANSQGQFDLTSVSAGAVELRARSEKLGSSEATLLELSPGQRIEGLHLVLRTPGRIIGEVLAAREGDTISKRDIEGYNSVVASSLKGSTDDKGQFMFDHVDPGDYTLVLQPSPEERARFTRPDGPAMQDYELDFALSKIRKVRVEAGAEAHVVFGPSKEPPIRIRGLVRRGENPAPAVHIRAVPLDDQDPRGGSHAWTDGSGRFELTVETPGQFRVQAMVNGMMGMPTGKQVDVPAGGVDSIEIALGSGRIAGTAHALGDVIAGGFIVGLERGESDRAWYTPDAAQWPEMSFEFKDLPAGTYTLVATAWKVDDRGRPRTMLEPKRQKIELGENQMLDDVRIEVGGN